MMRTMRAQMKWIMILVAVSFVGLMVFGWGMDITGRTASATGGELGRVNGEPVTFEEWDAVRRNLYDQQQRVSSAPIGAALDKQIGDAAWERVVAQKLVNQELKRRGIGVTRAEITELARVAPPQEFLTHPMFQTNGQFDLAKYQQFVASGDDELLLQLEAYYRDVIPRTKLFFQTTTGSYLSDSELWRMWQDSHETARVRYIFFDPTTLVPDARASVSSREIEQYYREHQDELQRPASASIRYVVLNRAPNAADTAAALERVQRLRQEIAGGAKFEDVAKRESADSASRVEGGNLGKLRKGMTAPAFEDAVFTLPLKTLSEPVKTQYGYHLIEVLSRTEEEAEARHILVPIALAPERDEALLTLADSLDDLGADAGGLAAAARALNLNIRTAEIGETLPFLPGVGQADEASVWAFDRAEVGEVSEVFESPTSYYMIELVERTEAGQQTLEEARAAITTRLMQQKKLEAAREIARRAADITRSGGTLEQAAQSVGGKVQEAGPFTRLELVPGLGQANAAIGTAFGLNPGQTSGVVEAEGALFIIQLIEKKPADRQEFEQQKNAQRDRVSNALAQQRWDQYMRALRENAKIIDNRAQVLNPRTTTTQ